MNRILIESLQEVFELFFLFSKMQAKSKQKVIKSLNRFLKIQIIYKFETV